MFALPQAPDSAWSEAQEGGWPQKHLGLARRSRHSMTTAAGLRIPGGSARTPAARSDDFRSRPAARTASAGERGLGQWTALWDLAEGTLGRAAER